jgi:toxin ParE1/3/4
MPKVYQRATARRDLVEQFVYLAENASLDTAERFLTNAETSFNDLADQPMIGAPLVVRHPGADRNPQMARQGFRQSLDLLSTTS